VKGGGWRVKEFLHHLSVARDSLVELETHLMLSHRRMLSGVRKALQKRL